MKKKLVVHPGLPKYASTRGNQRRSSQKQKAVGNLANIAFYWLVQVREQTTKQQTGKEKRKKRKIKPEYGSSVIRTALFSRTTQMET